MEDNMALFTPQEALDYHSEVRPGKVEVVPVKPYSTQKHLTMAYSPGVQIKMNVTWEALNPIMDYVECVDEKQTKMSSKVASEHYEQFGDRKSVV